MTILDALERVDKDVRVTCGYRWLVWTHSTGRFAVYERMPYQRHTREILDTDNESDAVKALTSEK